VVAITFSGGCAVTKGKVEKNLMNGKNFDSGNPGVADRYVVACPDVLEIEVEGRPDLSGAFAIGPDGRIHLDEEHSPRVEGHTPPEIAQTVAEHMGEDQDQIKVRVSDYRSQHVLLFGQVIGWQRSVPYRGQETVLELLQRVGGITAGAEPGDVYVVRAHVEDGQRPEVFHVDLRAIVLERNPSSNIRLLPFDQIYVGETRKARLEKLVPPWLRPMYYSLWGTDREKQIQTTPREQGWWRIFFRSPIDVLPRKADSGPVLAE